MNASNLRAIHRILKHTHADLGDALSPFFDDPRHGPAIVTAARSLYDALDELEAVIVAELAALAQAERDNDTERAAARCIVRGLDEDGSELTRVIVASSELDEAIRRTAAACPYVDHRLDRPGDQWIRVNP